MQHFNTSTNCPLFYFMVLIISVLSVWVYMCVCVLVPFIYWKKKETAVKDVTFQIRLFSDFVSYIWFEIRMM